MGIIAGLVALLWPGLTANGLVYVIAGWAVVTGVLEVLTAILLRAEVENGWLLAGSGALSTLFGILLAVLARSGVPFLAPFISGFAVLVGTRPDRFRLPVAGAETMSVARKRRISPRGYASLGDDQPPCRGLCSRASCRAGAGENCGQEAYRREDEDLIMRHVVNNARPDRR
jgi:Short repeat of unknown function (DUF308)